MKMKVDIIYNATIATKILARQSKMNIIVYPFGFANENDIKS
jgi:hypothetical protein